MLTAQWDNLVPRFPAAIAELWEDFLELGMPTPGDKTQPVPRNTSWVRLQRCPGACDPVIGCFQMGPMLLAWLTAGLYNVQPSTATIGVG